MRTPGRHVKVSVKKVAPLKPQHVAASKRCAWLCGRCSVAHHGWQLIRASANTRTRGRRVRAYVFCVILIARGQLPV